MSEPPPSLLRPEVPEGVVPGPLPRPPERSGPGELAAFPFWTPFAAGAMALVVALIGAALISTVIEATGGTVDPEELPPAVVIGATLLQGIGLCAGAVLFAGVGGVRPTPRAFGLRLTPFWKAVGWAFAAAMTFYVFSFVWSIALDITENDNLPEELGAKDSTLNAVAVAVMVCVAAPITEEFFFRGFCFPAFSTLLGWIGGAVLTGLVFGAIHLGGTDAVFIVPLMVFGFALCLLYKFTGSILPCIALHAVNNAVALSVFMKWEVWQGALMVVGAPTLCVLLALPLARRVRADA